MLLFLVLRPLSTTGGLSFAAGPLTQCGRVDRGGAEAFSLSSLAIQAEGVKGRCAKTARLCTRLLSSQEAVYVGKHQELV